MSTGNRLRQYSQAFNETQPDGAAQPRTHPALREAAGPRLSGERDALHHGFEFVLYSRTAAQRFEAYFSEYSAVYTETCCLISDLRLALPPPPMSFT